MDCTDSATFGRPPFQPIVKVTPYYPMDAYLDEVEGWVVVQFSIGPEGQVVNPSVLASQPPGAFDEEAIATVSQWRYCPPGTLHRYPDVVRARLEFSILPAPTWESEH